MPDPSDGVFGAVAPGSVTLQSPASQPSGARLLAPEGAAALPQPELRAPQPAPAGVPAAAEPAPATSRAAAETAQPAPLGRSPLVSLQVVARTVKVGEDLVVRLHLMSATQPLDAVQLMVSYPPELLRVATPATPVEPAPGRLLQWVLLNRSDATQGKVELALGRDPGQPAATGDYDLGTLRLTAVRSGQADIRLSGPVDGAFQGALVTVESQGAAVTVGD